MDKLVYNPLLFVNICKEEVDDAIYETRNPKLVTRHPHS